jgi:hypothetical protein
MRKIAVLIVLVVAGGTAAAQPSLTAPSPRPAPVERGDELSEGTALALSLGGTLASYGLLVGAAHTEGGEGYEAMATVGSLGTFFAPSFGHWYAGAIGTRGMAMRAGGAATAMVAIVWAFEQCPLFAGEDECNETPGPALLAIVGAGLWVGGTIDDIVQAPRRVRRHNARLRELTIAPLATRDGGGGLVLAGRF